MKGNTPFPRTQHALDHNNGDGNGNGQADRCYLSLADSPIENAHGSWKSCQHNSRIWLSEERVSVRYNEFSLDISIDGSPLRDEHVTALKGRIEVDTRTPWSIIHVREAILELAHANRFNPLTDWLNSLKWDRVPRLDCYFARVWQCTEHGLYLQTCARVLFGSAVARAFKPGEKADALVVLQGGQGTKKSSAALALCPEDHPEWFAEDLGCDIDSDKAGNSLRGKWLIELGEFNRINRQTIECVKQFLSRRFDHFKMPYDRYFIDQPRSCTFIGTTNNQEPLIDDENRRFFPLACPAVGDVEWIEANRDQLWAEAVVRHQAGIPWWVDTREESELATLVRERQDAARRIDDLDGVLAASLNRDTDASLSAVLAAASIPMDRYDRAMQTRIGNSLTRIGYERDKSIGWRQRPPKWAYKGPATS